MYWQQENNVLIYKHRYNIIPDREDSVECIERSGKLFLGFVCIWGNKCFIKNQVSRDN